MDKRCLCIVMDYADGGDLYTKIANQKKIGKGNYLYVLDRISLLHWGSDIGLVCLNGTSYQAYSWSKDIA